MGAGPQILGTRSVTLRADYQMREADASSVRQLLTDRAFDSRAFQSVWVSADVWARVVARYWEALSRSDDAGVCREQQWPAANGSPGWAINILRREKGGLDKGLAIEYRHAKIVE